MSGNFRFTRWDPILITSQIIAIQASYYVTLGVLFFVFSHLLGHLPTLDQMFNFEILNFRTSVGWLITFTFMINSLVGAVLLWFVVERAKPCLDFTLTTFFLHFLFTSLYNTSFPSTFSWWFLNALCVAIMCIAGEYLCLKAEMKSIPLLVAGGKPNSA